jgi:hypothetical protein
MDTKEAVAEATRIVSEAQRQGMVLRVLGAVAFRIHCSRNSSVYEVMDRPISDIDFAGYSRQKKEVLDFLEGLGYRIDSASLLMYEDRFIMDNAITRVHIDVFFDCLNMCHMIDLRGRLQLDFPTITVTDLLLEKMQIVRIEPKDIKDTIMLFAEHGLCNGGDARECIDKRHLCTLLSSDWGFYHTVTTNLEKVRRELGKDGVAPGQTREEVNARIAELLTELGKCPKTIRWRMRARVGTRRRWYHDVEERTR